MSIRNLSFLGIYCVALFFVTVSHAAVPVTDGKTSSDKLGSGIFKKTDNSKSRGKLLKVLPQNPGMPNFTGSISNRSAKKSVFPGDRVKIFVYLVNEGKSTSMSIKVAGTMKFGGEIYESQNIISNGLKQGQRIYVPLQFDLAKAAKAGLYSVTVNIDPENEIAESDETDNILDMDGRVKVHSNSDKVKADLKIMKIQINKPPFAAGGKITGAVAVVNRGGTGDSDYNVTFRITGKDDAKVHSRKTEEVYGAGELLGTIAGEMTASHEKKIYDFSFTAPAPGYYIVTAGLQSASDLEENDYFNVGFIEVK